MTKRLVAVGDVDSRGGVRVAVAVEDAQPCADCGEPTCVGVFRRPRWLCLLCSAKELAEVLP